VTNRRIKTVKESVEKVYKRKTKCGVGWKGFENRRREPIGAITHTRSDQPKIGRL